MLTDKEELETLKILVSKLQEEAEINNKNYLRLMILDNDKSGELIFLEEKLQSVRAQLHTKVEENNKLHKYIADLKLRFF
jgi:hypothetical protein